jgi:hypothetical protein
MFKVLVLQTLYTLSDDQTEYQLKDRLSFMRFVGLVLHDPLSDAKTIWLYREQLARASTAEELFARFRRVLRAKGWLAMGGQIMDATVIEARRRRLTRAEKDTIRGGGRRPSGNRHGVRRLTMTGAGLLRGKQDENSTSIGMRKCRRMRDEGRAYISPTGVANLATGGALQGPRFLGSRSAG